MFCQTVRNGGRLHHWIIDTLIANPVLPAADYLYDRAICSAVRKYSFSFVEVLNEGSTLAFLSTIRLKMRRQICHFAFSYIT